MASKDAAYYKRYRETRKTVSENKDQELVRRGRTMEREEWINYFRHNLAGRAFTGHQLAVMLERASDIEPQEVTARRQFVDALRGGQGEAR